MTEPEFLSVEDVVWLHARQLELYGGLEGVRDAGLETHCAKRRASRGSLPLRNAGDAFVLVKRKSGSR